MTRRIHPTQLLDVLERLGSPLVMVVGDLMLDRYTWGSVTRISPEAPVPVLSVRSRESRPGGAASAASLLAGLEASVDLVGVVGDDEDGRTLLRRLGEAGIDMQGVQVDTKRSTTVKVRVAVQTPGCRPHQIVRIDEESCRPLDEDIEHRLIDYITGRIGECQALLISDYGKGCCTPRLLRSVIEAASERDIPVLVDPATGTDWSRYAGCTLLKCNRREAASSCRSDLSNQLSLQRAVRSIREVSKAKHVIITLDGDGMFCDGRHYSTSLRPSVDSTAAGDMALAALGICVAECISIDKTVQFANLAAGLEVQHVGCTPVTRMELRAELLKELGQNGSKIVSREVLTSIAKAERAQNKRIVFTNGCFAAIHAGHIAYLREAKTFGDILIVAINSGESINRLKGKRPIIPDSDRLTMLSALAFVDYVLLQEDDTPHALLEAIQPDLLVKGGTTDFVVGKETVESWGGQVRILSAVPGVSTTQLLASAGGISLYQPLASADSRFNNSP